MDERVFEKLEFDDVRRLLAEEATYSGGKELALGCKPETTVAVAERRQQETAEGLRFLDVAGDPPFRGMRDVRDDLQRATIGQLLFGHELRDISSTLKAGVRLKSYLRRHQTEAEADILPDLGSVIQPFGELVQTIDKAINDDGKLVDDASPKLKDIRGRLRRAQRRVRQHLDQLIHSEKGRKMLQDPIVTIRSGRLVVPVRQQYRQHIPGIVHDQSASGSTLFVEPLGVVEINNEVRTLEREEEREVERIYTEITAMVASDATALQHTFDIVAELDFIFAKSRLARRWRAIKPTLTDDGLIKIVRGRHPLLSGKVVPIDVAFGGERRALVITGPNTGGKTVTLKTIGLFSLLAAAGLHIPADEGSQLPVFRRIHVDIGDEQSIEQSLSTFSSHMTHIIDMIDDVDDDTLVLLDELGAGTDPAEGSALAIALLEYFIHKRALVVATTHYGELKHFAYTHPHVTNASVQFDLDTLRPTYKLSMGIAGQSNAFAIAKRLGLAQPIIDRAKDELTESEIKVEHAIAQVHADLAQAEKDKEDARKLKERYASLYETYRQKEAALNTNREQILKAAMAEAKSIVENAKRESEELLGQLRRSRDIEDDARRTRKRLESMGQSWREAMHTDEPVDGRRDSERAEALTGVEKGSIVTVNRWDTEGEVIEVLGDGRYVIRAGSLRLTVSDDDISPVSDGTPPKEQKRRPATTPLARSAYGHLARKKAGEMKREIDMRGLVVEEALEALDKYIDDAVLAGIDHVRIIHGKGTGRLRHATHEFLAEDSRVKQYRSADPSAGGTGATEVML